MTRNAITKKTSSTANFKKKAKIFYRSAKSFKREISAIITEASEILADKTAREGLFGEDRDSRYCSTNVDYIPDNAIELRYISYSALSAIDGNAKNHGVLKCFNGF